MSPFRKNPSHTAHPGSMQGDDNRQVSWLPGRRVRLLPSQFPSGFVKGGARRLQLRGQPWTGGQALAPRSLL